MRTCKPWLSVTAFTPFVALGGKGLFTQREGRFEALTLGRLVRLREIAELLGVTEQRADQLRNRADFRLRSSAMAEGLSGGVGTADACRSKASRELCLRTTFLTRTFVSAEATGFEPVRGGLGP
jgi:hypothetical protein